MFSKQGYPNVLKDAIVKKLHMDEFVDAHVCALDVRAGRPAPYMTFRLMEACGVEDVRTVAKAGDSGRDFRPSAPLRPRESRSSRVGWARRPGPAFSSKKKKKKKKNRAKKNSK